MDFNADFNAALPPLAAPTQICQPDSLKLSASLQTLRWFHQMASKIDKNYGDKSSNYTFFLVGVQGELSKPSNSRDYSYFLAKLQEIRQFLSQSLGRSALDDLTRTALDIYNRFDNRRRMGVELMVLAMMITKHSTWFEIPDKYHSHTFVLEMLASMRHRFQKPDVCYFWSCQSQRLLSSAFQQTRHLAKLKLAIVNDDLLKSIAIHCRALQELEVQFALDVSEEGLFALAGKSIKMKDQGNPRKWKHARSLVSDFGTANEWFIKDSLIFTLPSNHTLNKPAEMEDIPEFHDTGFGCTELVKLRINGHFIFPPLARRYQECQMNIELKGPILEFGFYVILLSLTKLKTLTMACLPMVIARLGKISGHKAMESMQLSLQSLKLDRDLLLKDEFNILASLCRNISEISNVSPDCARNIGDFTPLGPSVYDRHYSPEVCSFLKKLEGLRVFRGRMTLPCFNSFLKLHGANLSKIQLTTSITNVGDLVLFRKYVPNLHVFEGRVSVTSSGGPVQTSGRAPQTHFNPMRNHLGSHKDDETAAWENLVLPGNFTDEMVELLEKYPLRKLVKLDVEGRLNIGTMQLLVGNAEFLEELFITNSPLNKETKALSDEWLEALVHVNPLKSIKKITLRMDNDQTVECGSFSDRGLTKFLNHCLRCSPKLTELTGEFTRIPDTLLWAKTEHFVRKGLRRLDIRNAVPYRRFENIHDIDRFYGVNEGYQNLMQNQQLQLQHHIFHVPHPLDAAPRGPGHPQSQRSRNGLPKRFEGYVFRPYPKPPPSDGYEAD
eukprot:maker-scaffold159_size295958-snap-gene-1.28 protein:Tk05085 transcript:maker-scaffold159_size295958-snap-gene-1.28-mRNA-1 annotation:"conserved hypothetical protein"